MTKEETKKIIARVKDYDAEIYLTRGHIESLCKTELYDTRPHIRELEKKIRRLSVEKAAMSRAIERVKDPIARMIYTSRIMLGDPWRETVTKVRGTERNLRYIYDRNLDELCTLIGEEMAWAMSQFL